MLKGQAGNVNQISQPSQYFVHNHSASSGGPQYNSKSTGNFLNTEPLHVSHHVNKDEIHKGQGPSSSNLNHSADA